MIVLDTYDCVGYLCLCWISMIVLDTYDRVGYL